MENKFERSESWFSKVGNIGIKVHLALVGKDHTPQGKGLWCYYLYIYEPSCPKGLFAKWWLEDQVVKYTPEAYGRVTHDYYQFDNVVDLHCGITFYKKHGHTEGHRCIEIGCDYNHLWDQDGVNKDDVFSDAVQSAEQLDAYIKGLLQAAQ